MSVLLVLLALRAALAATVPVLDVRGGIDPGTADYVIGGIRAAAADGAPAVVLRLDTPGGLLTSTRDIVQAELGAEVPVIVWVEPAGARAASAGVFITMAAHVAAMAPGTTIGAAHPVELFGGGGGEDDAQRQVMEEKVLSDASAWARAIAAQRDRNADWAERAVRESVAVTATEAVELDVVDLVATDIDDLLRRVHGTTVQTAAGPITLDTAGAATEAVDMTLRQRVLHVLGDPNVVFVLFALGALGLYTEFQSPGLVLPGVLGAIALIAAAIGLSIVPFNAGGLLLLVLGFLLLGAEVIAATGGMLAVGGVISVVLGGLLLFEVEGFDLSVHPATLAIVGVIFGAVAVAVAVGVARTALRPVATGEEALVGLPARVTVGGDGGGRVQLAGEDWRAIWTGAIDPGTRVRVVRVRGLTVEVEPMEEA